MNEFLKREAILARQDLPFEDVEVPEWGGTLRICGLSGDAAIEYGSRRLTDNPKDNYMADLLALTIVDKDFKPLFTSQDVEALGKKSARVLRRLTLIATRLSGMGENAKAEAKKN